MAVAFTLIPSSATTLHAPKVALSNAQRAPAAATSVDGWGGLAAKATAFAAASIGLALNVGRHRRSTVACRYYGSKAMSYKDYNDPWLTFADNNFDPLGLATQGGTFDTGRSSVPETTYYNYRESEIKHGRFAMAAFGAIFAEENDKSALLNQLNFPGYTDNLDATIGLDEVQGPVLAFGLGIQALAEYNLQRSESDGNFLSVQYNRSRCPGDLGFDPLRFRQLSGKGDDIKTLHNTELQFGRLAMLGITAFLTREFITHDL